MHGRLGGMFEIGGIEPIVAQVVVEYLESREVFGPVAKFQRLLDSKQQVSFAQIVAVKSVSRMAHGADGEDD